MRACSRSLLALAALLIAGTALAQERAPGYLGVNIRDVTKEEAEKLGWEAPRGAKVVGTVEGSPAAAAGVAPDDLIAAVDGTEVENFKVLIGLLTAKGAGTTVKVRLIRAGKEKTVTATLGALPANLAGADSRAPHLMLDTGGHMHYVGNVAFTPDGKQVVSGSTDATVRVWDVESGKTVRIIRGDAVPGAWGPIYAMALSPDGRWLATGGLFHDTDTERGGAIRIYDFASGRLETVLKGHDNVVLGLAFSPDNARLVSGSSDKTAIVWDLATRQQVLRLSGHTEKIDAVAFTSDSKRVVTGSDDETLRLWNASDGKLIAEMTEHRRLALEQGRRQAAESNREFRKTDVWDAGVRSIAVSPTEPLIASKSADSRILLWDSRTGAFLRQFAFPGGARGRPSNSVSFSPDGHWLLSAGFWGCTVYETATGKELYGGRLDRPIEFVGEKHVGCIDGTAYSPDGRLAVGSYNASVRLIDPRTSQAVKSLQGSAEIVFGVGFAADSRALAWGHVNDHVKMENGEYKHKLTRQLHLPAAGKPLGIIEQFDADSTSGLPAASRPNQYLRGSPKHGSRLVRFKRANPDDNLLIDTRVIELEDNFGKAQKIVLENPASPDSLILSADGQSVLVGVRTNILAYDLKGQVLGRFVGHFGGIRDFAPSPDGRFLVSGSDDQTVRLWNLKTHELIVSLYDGSDGEWVMWTPQGYYTGSPGADKIVGWQINKGPEQAPEYVGADQLRQHLNRPDIVEKAIILASAEEAVRQAPGTSLKLPDLLARAVPRFKIVSPAPASAGQGGRASVRIAIETTPDPVRLIRVQVNGRQVEEQTPEVGSGGFGTGERVLNVPLAKGRNDIRVSLTNAIGERAETLVLTHEAEGALDTRGTLHILAIGVNEYKGLGTMCGSAGCDLRYSVADARKLADAVERRLGPGHARVVKRVLVNGGDARDIPTASNIMDALEPLRQSKENDTVVLFIAGHGVNDGPDYRFVPTDAEWSGGALRGSRIVPWQVLQSAIEAAKGRRVLFVDTCHSGNAYNQRLGNAAYHANIIAYTAARFDQEALEDASLGHGLFTYAVVEGLDGKGEFEARRRISTKDLAGYVAQRVGDLAKVLKGEQEPQYFKGRDADDYVLAQW